MDKVGTGDGFPRRTRTGDGFPGWKIVRGDARLFDWYTEESVTELGWQQDGQVWRVAVDDRFRLVIRAAVAPVGDGLPDWAYWPRLDGVPGFVRCFYGPDAYGHTEYYVARDATGVELDRVRRVARP